MNIALIEDIKKGSAYAFAILLNAVSTRETQFKAIAHLYKSHLNYRFIASP